MDDVAKRAPNIAHYRSLKDCDKLQDAFETQEFRELISKAVPKSLGIAADQMIRTFTNAANRAPNIYKCNFRDALGKFMTLAYLGLRPGPDLGLAHLIPFERTKYDRASKTRVHDGYDLQIIIGYQGYVELAFRSGFVKDVATGAVYPGDIFDFERGSERFLRHRPSLDTDNNGITPRAVWAMFKFTNGGEEFDVMSWSEVERIRNRTQAYRAALAAKAQAEEKKWRLPVTWTEAPWVLHEAEMARKTVLRRLSKLVPRCPELHFATSFEEAQDRGANYDFSPIIEGDANPIEDGVIERPAESDGEAPSTDPGAAFADRRENREQTRTESAQESDFGPAVIYDAYGNLEEEGFIDPAAFARRIVTKWTGYNDPDRAAFLEFNEGWIDEARAYVPEILAQLEQDVEPPVATVELKVVRGRPSYSGYMKDLETAGAATPSHMVERWIEAQKPVVAKLPFAQRMQAIKLLTQTAGRAKVALPRWVTDAMEHDEPGNGDEGKENAQTETKPDPDEEWVTRQLREFDKIGKMDREEAEKAYRDTVGGSAVKHKVEGIEARNPAQFERYAEARNRLYASIFPDQAQ